MKNEGDKIMNRGRIVAWELEKQHLYRTAKQVVVSRCQKYKTIHFCNYAIKLLLFAFVKRVFVQPVESASPSTRAM
jgi:hypothetical protein